MTFDSSGVLTFNLRTYKERESRRWVQDRPGMRRPIDTPKDLTFFINPNSKYKSPPN